MSLSWFSQGSYILFKLEFGGIGFCKRRKTGKPREEQSKARTKNKLIPTYTTPQSNLGHIDGRQALASLPGGEVLPEELGRGVRPASQNPYPIYDENLLFSLPYL